MLFQVIVMCSEFLFCDVFGGQFCSIKKLPGVLSSEYLKTSKKFFESSAGPSTIRCTAAHEIEIFGDLEQLNN